MCETLPGSKSETAANKDKARSSFMMLNIGALVIRIGFGVYYTVNITRNPRLVLVSIKAPILCFLPC